MPAIPSAAAGNTRGEGFLRKNNRLLKALNKTAIEKITDSSPELI
ncbi:Uncharacterised protein [Cedecea neteri]|uniref:Uncharacterized protein n=1 Tax=Cedecea neteri TaxID=158822 RepID=A0A2X3JEF8_9ENTR|nr:Uncharacterised protein [Cedecea neteri]